MKLLVNIHIPAIGKDYDVLVPKDMRIKIVGSLIARTVENLSGRLYVTSGKESLFSAEKNIYLKPNTTLEAYGIQNGAHLVLM